MTLIPRAVVVIPTYDEAGNIREVLDRTLAATALVDVLVVDDSSPDGTGRLVQAHEEFGRRVHLLVRPGKAGLGAAYRAGFGWALDRGYDVVVQMDADLSHPPERLPALIEALTEHDVAVGSRYVSGGSVRNWTLARRLISRLGNLYVAMVLGLPVRDATAGFKAFRAEALAEIDAVVSESNGYSFQIENTWQAVRRGLTVVEVPITFTDRTRGASKMSGAIVLEAVVRVLGWRLEALGPRARREPRSCGERRADAALSPDDRDRVGVVERH
jgi:dolichol-phosphate mannosyltransferase